MKLKGAKGIIALAIPLAVLSTAIAGGGSVANAATSTREVIIAVDTFSKETLDPSMDGTSALNYFGEQYDYLIGATPDGKVSFANGVLASMKANADGTQYTMKLKEGIKWHDGSPMTAEDIAFTMTYMSRPQAGCTFCSTLKTTLASVAVVDPLTVTIKLKEPNFNLVTLMSPAEGSFLVVPKGVIEKIGSAKFAQAPVGSGPWIFAGRKLGEYVQYVANENYWNKDRIPKFAKLKVVLVKDALARNAMIKQGQADLSLMTAADISQVTGIPGVKLVGPKNVAIGMLVFWGSSRPDRITNKLRIRQAMALAVDWDTIAQVYFPKVAGTRHRGGAAPFSAASIGADPTLKPYPYNPSLAKKLLKQAGYRNEPINYWNYDGVGSLTGLNAINETIATFWRMVGLNVQMKSIDFNTFRDKYKSVPQKFEGPADVSIMAIGTRPAMLANIQVQFLRQSDGGTTEAYWNPTFGKAQLDAFKSVSDPVKLEASLKAFNRKVYKEYWAIPWLSQNLIWAQGPNIASWSPINNTDSGYAFETLVPAN